MNLNNLDPGITISYTDPERQFLDEARSKLGMQRDIEPEDPDAAFRDFFRQRQQ